MKATIIERNWVVEWFDERQCPGPADRPAAGPWRTTAICWRSGTAAFCSGTGTQWAGTPRTGCPYCPVGDTCGPIRTPWAVTYATAAMTPFSSKTTGERSSSSLPSFWTRRPISSPGAMAGTSCGCGRPGAGEARRHPVRPRLQRQRPPAGRHHCLRLYQQRAAGQIFRRGAHLSLKGRRRYLGGGSPSQRRGRKSDPGACRLPAPGWEASAVHPHLPRQYRLGDRGREVPALLPGGESGWRAELEPASWPTTIPQRRTGTSAVP